MAAPAFPPFSGQTWHKAAVEEVVLVELSDAESVTEQLRPAVSEFLRLSKVFTH